ncbi:hypothetical protein GS528_16235 [Rhodococcus hoagii]|nr:hypothetical protein [Prescottella equi]
MTNNANPPTGNNSARKPRWLRPNIEDPVALRRRERVEVGYRRFPPDRDRPVHRWCGRRTYRNARGHQDLAHQQPHAQGDWVVVQLFGAAALALLLVASAVSVWGVAAYGKAAGQPSPRQR